MAITTVVCPTKRPDGTHHRTPCPAQTTPVPGLVICPALGYRRDNYPEADDLYFTGTFNVIHQASGEQVFGMNDDIYGCEKLANALGQLPVDWTAPEDTIQTQIHDNRDEMSRIFRQARYADLPEPATTSTPGDIAPYPRTITDATADAITAHLLRALQHQLTEIYDLNHDPKREKQLADAWALVLAIREIKALDPEMADRIAQLIWDGWEDGSTITETVYTWAREYGLPPLPPKE